MEGGLKILETSEKFAERPNLCLKSKRARHGYDARRTSAIRAALAFTRKRSQNEADIGRTFP